MSDGWKPTVAVIGAGAMGSLFGGLLREGGLEVVLVDVWKEHVDAIEQGGLKLVGHGGDRYVRVRATTDPAGLEPVDVVLVQCKAPYTEAAVIRARNLFGDGTVAVSFQNGLGNEEIIGGVIEMERVLGGVTAQGASIEGPGVTRTYGDLPSRIGEMTGGLSERALRVATALSAAGLQTSASEDIRFEIWKKLMVNIAVSPTCAVANLTIGEVMAVPELRETALEALAEAVAVANAEGVELDRDEAEGALMQISGPRGTSGNKSSVCVDILNRRKSEIDVINGAIVRLGRANGVPTPVNKTLVAAIKGLESRYL